MIYANVNGFVKLEEGQREENRVHKGVVSEKLKKNYNLRKIIIWLQKKID